MSISYCPNYQRAPHFGKALEWINLFACLSTQRYTLHGHWLQTSTATGRLSIEEEPSMTSFDFFVPTLSLSQPEGDVFTNDGPHDRDQTKRLIYGMGANRLAEQLECSSDEEAKEKIRSFLKILSLQSRLGLTKQFHFCQEKGYMMNSCWKLILSYAKEAGIVAAIQHGKCGFTSRPSTCETEDWEKHGGSLEPLQALMIKDIGKNLSVF
ncbi:hypothetical protein HID58_013275 [Brassica napus]|uniref:Uncharacterized protein n=2 Tax=Brassica TaxID=3705 RepID=A0A3P6AGD0_BRACM|nr:hypothetical protein HID58_013275 [Brassica napus]CAF2133256.1 unnamed protein product [Brassica napus]CAG7885223.1 unnamed protein product [Brassica rapa]CDY70660.1 BnaAnng34530D [Brassica napus]VDC84240.1 unnamed protein product [Brassica rapa]